MSKVIGLTGRIGSGKSTVARILAGLGAIVIDADKTAHQVYAPGTEAYDELVKTFGKVIVAPDKSIDRKKLGEIVFKDPEKLNKLNQIVQPRTFSMVKNRIDENKRQGKEIIVLEAALLLEAGWKSLVDEVWVVITEPDKNIKRAADRSALPEEQVRSRGRSQMSEAERLKQADVVIRNDGTIEDLMSAVNEIWLSLSKKK